VAETLRPPPLWFRAARAAVRRLPAGRFRAFELVARIPVPPFADRLGPEAGGYAYRCDLRHLIARETCLTGRYAPVEGALVRSCLPPDGSFVDVGANFGYFALLGAAAVGARGRVLAVEPDPRMAAELRANLALNALAQVEVLAAAASDREGTASLAGFTEEGGNWGVSSLLGAAEGEAPRFQVRCAPLDALLDEAGVDGVELAKVDVEGAEALVLEGMSAGVRRRRYRRVLVEFHPWHFADFAAALGEADARMRAAGYRGWLVDEAAAATRALFYGAPPRFSLLPLSPAGAAGPWPHVLWTLPGAEPA
jgi:FkbM family methyltransferase